MADHVSVVAGLDHISILGQAQSVETIGQAADVPVDGVDAGVVFAGQFLDPGSGQVRHVGDCRLKVAEQGRVLLGHRHIRSVRRPEVDRQQKRRLAMVVKPGQRLANQQVGQRPFKQADARRRRLPGSD